MQITYLILLFFQLLFCIKYIIADKTMTRLYPNCTNRQIMAYSIDQKYNNCAQMCIYPIFFNFLKLFEPGFTITNDNNICTTKGYYFSEPKNHFFIKIDMYKPSK